MRQESDSLVPTMRDDIVRSDFDLEAVVWSPIRTDAFTIDPVARVLMDVIDGEASIAELVMDVQQTVGVPLDTARTQVLRSIALFDQAGLLQASVPEPPPARRELFVNPPNT